MESPRHRVENVTERQRGRVDLMILGDLSNSYSLLTHMSQSLTLNLRLRKANWTAA